MGEPSKLNGSVDMLAQAMRKVFSEAVEGAVEPLRDDIAVIGDSMATRADIETTNKNMQSQFAEQEKKIGQLLKGPA